MFENTTRIGENHIACVAKLRLQTTAFLIYRVGLIAFALLFIIWSVSSWGTADGIAYLVLAIICALTSIWGMPALLKARSMRVVSTADVRSYIFNETSLTARVAGEGVNVQDTVAYSRFDQLVVGRDALYLRLARGKQFLVIDSEGFTKGNAEDCAKHLERAGIKTIWSYAK